MNKLLSRRRALGALIGLTAGWLAAGAMTAHAQKATNYLEGTWHVTATPAEKSNGKELKITLVIKPDVFTVTEWEKQLGFKPAEYQTDQRRFGPVKFDGTLTSESKGIKTKWSGTAESQDSLTGEMTWVKKNGDEIKYTFKGEKK
jgi:hypothetical protein